MHISSRGPSRAACSGNAPTFPVSHGVIGPIATPFPHRSPDSAPKVMVKLRDWCGPPLNAPSRVSVSCYSH